MSSHSSVPTTEIHEVVHISAWRCAQHVTDALSGGFAYAYVIRPSLFGCAEHVVVRMQFAAYRCRSVSCPTPHHRIRSHPRPLFSPRTLTVPASQSNQNHRPRRLATQRPPTPPRRSPRHDDAHPRPLPTRRVDPVTQAQRQNRRADRTGGKASRDRRQADRHHLFSLPHCHVHWSAASSRRRRSSRKR